MSALAGGRVARILSNSKDERLRQGVFEFNVDLHIPAQHIPLLSSSGNRSPILITPNESAEPTGQTGGPRKPAALQPVETRFETVR